MKKVAIVRGRYIDESEILNYEAISDFDLTLIGATGTEYDGPLKYETFPSAATAPSGFLQKGATALSGMLFGSNTHLYGLTEALEKYDIVHVAETYHGYASQAIKAKRRYDCKVVSTVWQNIPYFLEDGHYSRGIEQRIAYANADSIKARFREEADAFLAVTGQVEFALENEGVDIDRIHHVPIGVDPERFNPGQLAESGHQHSDYGFDVEAVNVVFVGRTPWEKGIFDLLSAWKVVERRIETPANLSLIGATANRERLEGFSDHLNLSNSSIFGPVPYKEVPVVMDAADILVLPSIPTKEWQEQYGRVVPEAQACGTAIIASDTGGIPEAAGYVGEFVRPGDAQDIAETLITLIEEDERRLELAKTGRERIEQELTLEDTAKKVANVYRNMSS